MQVEQTAPSMRASRLREVAARALDESIAGCTEDEFCDGFGLDAKHRPLLQHVFAQAQHCLRENSLAEFEVLMAELGVGSSLGRLDSLIAQQPELPDGSRLCAPPPPKPPLLTGTRDGHLTDSAPHLPPTCARARPSRAARWSRWTRRPR